MNATVSLDIAVGRWTSRPAGGYSCPRHGPELMTVRVAFDSRPAKEDSGIGRYTRCMLAALRDAGRGEIVETSDPRRCDVFHAPSIDETLLRSPVPMVVTLHDLIALKHRGQYLRSGLRFKLRCLAVQRAVRVIAPTEAVADDAVSALEIPRDRVVVIAEAAAPRLHARPEQEVQAVRDRFGLPHRYLLWVGTLRSPDPHKRVLALARAPRKLPLVLVGATGPWAQELPDVMLTGAVDDDQLAAIYTGAHALISPSSEAGFGLSLVEALACGTPVVASDSPTVREVLGERATVRPVDDLEGLIAAAESARRPAPPPSSWTWDHAAAATWDVYAQAVQAPRRWRGARWRGAPTESTHPAVAARASGSRRAASRARR
jgi:glycosyltransferase involved in cell wall biosynthesis